MIRFWSGDEPSRFLWRGDEIGWVLRHGCHIPMRMDAVQVGDLSHRRDADPDGVRELVPVTRIEQVECFRHSKIQPRTADSVVD